MASLFWVAEMRSDDSGDAWAGWLRGLAGCAVVVLPLLTLALAGASCGTVERTVVEPLSNEGAEVVGNEACSGCHREIGQVFHASMHARVGLPGEPGVGATSCELCHGPGSKHVKVGGARRGGAFITNPGKDPAACLQCHLQVHAEFRQAHRHPVPEGHMNCVQCHDPHGHEMMKPSAMTGLASARRDSQCAECHREQSRPFVFEHEALREGCTICHQPHGSVNPKMLVQRDVNLCLRCHAQLPGPGGGIFIGKKEHSAELRRGGCWSAGCHTAVHGSNLNPHLRY